MESVEAIIGTPVDRRGPGGREIAVAVLRANAEHADRRQEQRRRPAHPEQFDAEVALRTVDHHPRDEAPAREGGDVAVLRALVAAAAGDIVEHRFGQRRAGARLEAGEIDRQPRRHAAQAVAIDSFW